VENPAFAKLGPAALMRHMFSLWQPGNNLYVWPHVHGRTYYVMASYLTLEQLRQASVHVCIMLYVWHTHTHVQ
jgi:hypothetical protein